MEYEYKLIYLNDEYFSDSINNILYNIKKTDITSLKIKKTYENITQEDEYINK
jgi:hypothetical protein